MFDKVLEKIEDYVQFDLRYYMKNASYLILAQGITMSFGLLLSITFARLLTKDLYGQWGYILSIIGILGIFTLPGMSTAIAQAVVKGHDRVLIEGTKEKFKWSIFGSIAVFGVGIYYFLNGSILLGKCFMVSSLFFPFYENFQTYNAFLSAKKSFDTVSKYQSITQALSTIVMVIVIYLSRNLMYILIAYFTSISLISGYFFASTVKKLENDDMDKDSISFGKHLTLMELADIIRMYYDKILIALFISFSDLAIYSIALGLTEQVKSLGSIISTLTFPKLAEMGKEKARSEVKKRLIMIVLCFAVICGFLIVLCPYIIPLLYSGKYLDSVFYAQILFVSVIVVQPAYILDKAFFPSQKMVKELYTIRISQPIFEIVLLSILVPAIGVLGAVLAKVLSRTFITIIAWLLVR